MEMISKQETLVRFGFNVEEALEGSVEPHPPLVGIILFEMVVFLILKF